MEGVGWIWGMVGVNKIIIMKPVPSSNFSEQREGIRTKVQAELKRLKALKAPNESTAHQIDILQQRLRLLSSYRELTGVRLNNLQKIFKHYCTHVFKTGHKVNFDRIVYQNEHLTIERFFAMVLDFQLNEVVVKEERKTAVDRNEIVLLFKKCSANARNLQFLQFITCVERLFVLLYDGGESFERRQALAREEKAQRAVEAKKRERYKMEKMKAKEQGLINVTAKDIELKIAAELEQSVGEKKENDGMVADLMKNFQIVNPTDEIAKAATAVKSGGEAVVADVADESGLFVLTSEEKIEYFMAKIGIDDVKEIEKRIRYFQKANFRYSEAEELSKLKGVPQPPQKQKAKPAPQSLLSKEITSTHEEWDKQKQLREQRNIQRLLNLKQQLSHRELQKNQSLLARSLSKEGYEQKKQKINQTFERKQKKFMQPLALERITKRQEEDETIYYNLEMVHRSTPNQLPFKKISPERFIARDSSDFLFMEEYMQEQDRSPHWRGFSGMARPNSQLVESAKRRAAEVERIENVRVNRYPENVVKQRRYLERYLQKK